jgi:ferric-dicitrate binding protein FerR (iron transport regulator)
MPDKIKGIGTIISKQLLRTPLTREEEQALEDWLRVTDTRRRRYEEITNTQNLVKQLHFYEEAEEQKERVRKKIIPLASTFTTSKMVLFRKWATTAAAIVLLVTGGYFLFLNKKDIFSSDKKVGVAQKQVIGGANKASLTIGRNQPMSLAAGKTGIVVNQTITYSDGEKITATDQLLQLTTPRGGQYQAVLPDGTRVWLNAASSIQFPSAFTGKQRKVLITGEAYFEIAKNKEKPFIVDVAGKSSVEVLGTAFNINSYADETGVRTTLIEGSVKVSAGSQGEASLILKPGQQAQIGTENKSAAITIDSNPDLAQVVAWKNGFFNFNHADIRTAMRQLSRWYDIDIIYKGKLPDKEFQGKLTRDLSLSQVLEILEEMNIKFILKGRTLTVEQK